MKKLSLICLLCAFIPFSWVNAQEVATSDSVVDNKEETTESIIYTVESVPNPKSTCAECFVVDPERILPAGLEEELNRKLNQLEFETTVEFCIVVLPQIDGYYDYFGQELGQYWGVGKEGVNNGVVWLYVRDERGIHISTGYGVEGILPDALLSNVLQEEVFPLMQQDRVAEAFNAGVDAIIEELSDESVREEVMLNLTESNDRIWWSNTIMWYLIIAMIILVLFAGRQYKKINKVKGSNQYRYKALDSEMSYGIILAIIFPVVLLPFYYYMKRIRRKIRNTPITCQKCGAQMHILSETEEDKYLDETKQLEENIKSIDYDVWYCDNCAAHITMSYAALYSKYKDCPACQAKTYKETSNRIIESATTTSTGLGVKTFACKNCSYTKEEQYTIPRKSSSSGGSGGSGGGGGSWGGGSFGGGGGGGKF